MASKYIAWVQRAKGWGILLIVLGHVAGGGIHLSTGSNAEVLTGVYKYLYSFHVELFFFLAGVTYSIAGKPFGAFVGRKARALLVPYLFWGLVSYGIYLAMSGLLWATWAASSTTGYYDSIFRQMDWWTPLVGLLHGGGWPNGNGLRQNSVLWFLMCLFTCEVAYYGYERYSRGRFSRVWSVALFLLAGCCVKSYEMPDLPFGVLRALQLGVFLALGRLCAAHIPQDSAPPNRTGGCLLSSLLVLVGLVVALGNPYTDFTVTLRAHTIYVMTACVSIAGWVGISLFGGGKWIELAGKHSLCIMVAHKFIVVAMQTRVPFCRDAYRQTLLESSAVTIGITLLAMAVCIGLGEALLRTAPWTVGKGWQARRSA